MRKLNSSSNVQVAKEISKSDAETVNRSFSNAVKMMTSAGFKVGNNVKVTVDPELPFMGYTMPQGRGFTIVVAGGAIGSGMLEGLLVHEMSHKYRIETIHPTMPRSSKQQSRNSGPRISATIISRKSSMIY